MGDMVSGQYVKGGGANFYSTNSNSGAPVSLPGAVSVDNWIIVAVAWDDAGNRTPVSMTDTAGTTYSLIQAKTREAAGSNYAVCMYMGKAASTSAGAGLVFTLSGGGGEFGRLNAIEASGLDTDQGSATYNGGTTAPGTSHSSGTATPANASGIIVAYTYRTNGTYTEDTDFTEIGAAIANDADYFGYIANPAVAATSLSYTSVDSEYSVAQIAAFVGASASSTPKGRMLIMGVG